MDNNILKKQTALIDSMTKQERLNPKIIQASRKIRIANGSGLKVQDINILLKQHEKSSEMMKKFKNLGLKGITNMFKSFNNIFIHSLCLDFRNGVLTNSLPTITIFCLLVRMSELFIP
jgi:signal recognition particle GTPase